MHHTADAFQRNTLSAGEWLGGSLQALHPHTVGEEQAADGRLYRFRQPTSFPTNDKAQTGPAFRVSPGRLWQPSKANGQSQEVQQAYTL